MKIRAAIGSLGLAAALGGCAALDSEQSYAQDRTQSLWSARTDFVGDNSGVVALANEVDFGPPGTHTFSLQTQQQPYAMTVVFDDIDKPFEDVDFSSPATLMLGLVDNLDKVSVTSGEQSYSLTASDASTALGYDVKDLGTDKAQLAEYVELDSD